MYKKFTKETVLKMLEKGILEIGQYVITNHYLLVSGKVADKTYDYLYKQGYCSAMQISSFKHKEEYAVIEINR